MRAPHIIGGCAAGALFLLVQGPTLYKEWKLTADAVGDGLFAGIVGKGQKLTPILHGSGNGCTDASHFTDWTLLIYGASRLTPYGVLER